MAMLLEDESGMALQNIGIFHCYKNLKSPTLNLELRPIPISISQG